jgi:TnpA family transposase
VHPGRGERLCERIRRGRRAVADKGEAVLGASGIDHLARNYLEMPLLLSVPAAHVAAVKSDHNSAARRRCCDPLGRLDGVLAHDFLAHPLRPVSDGARVLRRVERQQLGQQDRNLAEWHQRRISGGDVGVDGQKFGVERPTVKARHSRKYFGCGTGVVAYTLLCNHISLQGWIIGTHEFEAHHVFDIWYRNTSDIVPTTITGDMHSVNRANFAVLHWFGPRFEPRFTDLNAQLKALYCADDTSLYEKFLIRRVGQIDLQEIVNERANIDQIVATLGLKEMTQGTLIRKLCTYTQPNPTRHAIFEFDKLVRSIYTLRYLRNPQLQRDVQRSQNRLESYHQFRSAIAQVGGKKELTGRTDIEIEISNQCARLIANAIIFYNSAILSRLLTRLAESPRREILAMVKKVSSAAWRHIHLNGHYTFRGGGQVIDLYAIVAGLD